MKTLGEKIKSLMSERGITLEELSEKAGCHVEITKAVISDIVYPKRNQLCKIANVLGVTAASINYDFNDMIDVANALPDKEQLSPQNVFLVGYFISNRDNVPCCYCYCHYDGKNWYRYSDNDNDHSHKYVMLAKVVKWLKVK